MHSKLYAGYCGPGILPSRCSVQYTVYDFVSNAFKIIFCTAGLPHRSMLAWKVVLQGGKWEVGRPVG